MPSLNTRQMVCSLVTCTRFGAQQTCGLRAGSTGFPIAERVRFDRLILRAQIITGNDGRSGTVVMANTLNRNILPMHPSEFQFNLAPNDNAKYVRQIRNGNTNSKKHTFFSLFFLVL